MRHDGECTGRRRRWPEQQGLKTRKTTPPGRLSPALQARFPFPSPENCGERGVRTARSRGANMLPGNRSRQQENRYILCGSLVVADNRAAGEICNKRLTGGTNFGMLGESSV